MRKLYLAAALGTFLVLMPAMSLTGAVATLLGASVPQPYSLIASIAFGTLAACVAGELSNRLFWSKLREIRAIEAAGEA